MYVHSTNYGFIMYKYTSQDDKITIYSDALSTGILTATESITSNFVILTCVIIYLMKP